MTGNCYAFVMPFQGIIHCNFSQNPLLLLIVPLDHHHDGIAGLEIGVLLVEGVPAHDDRAVGEIAEHAAGVFARDAWLCGGRFFDVGGF